MAMVDERGRLFGRWNLLDLAVLIMLIGLIPLAYGAYLLFHDQPPTLVSLTPNRVEEQRELRIEIKGTNLRPYMRVSAGVVQARDFAFLSTEAATVSFAQLAPGTYDVILYDSAQERFRLPNALTVTASNLPSTEIVVIGAFGDLDAAGAAKLVPGTELPKVGQIVAVGKAAPDLTDVFAGAKMVAVPMPNALRVPAVVRMRCQLRTQQGTPYCTADGVTIIANAVLSLPTTTGTVLFQVQRVRSVAPVETVPLTMRLRGHPSVLSKIKAGDVDTGGVNHELGVLSRIESAGSVRTVGDGAAELDVRLLANVQRAEQGWLYDSAPLRLGATIVLRNADYEAGGIVTDIGAPRR